jgi:hypothetical protein
VGVFAPVGLEDRELLPVLEADSPVEIEAVADTVSVLLPLNVEEGVLEAVPVPLEVEVPLDVGVGVAGGVEEAEKEALPEALGDAPWEREGVGERLTVLLPLSVEDGVVAPVPVPLLVGLPVEEGEGDCVPVGLEDKELLPVLEAESPFEMEAVGEAVIVLLPLTTEEGLPEGVPLPLGVAMMALRVEVMETVEDSLSVALGHSVGDSVPVMEGEVLLDCVTLMEKLRDTVGLRVTLAQRETVREGVALWVTLKLSVGECVWLLV